MSAVDKASAARPRLHILDEDDDDPVLSTINLIDVFLVVIGMLLIAVINNPMNPFIQSPGDKLTIIRNEGKPNMEIITKDGQKITRFKSSGASGEGDGEKAGTAYRMKDGSLVYVPATSNAAKP